MINFFFEQIEEIKINKTSIVEMIKNIISNENKKLGKINYIFCDDEYLLKINQEYLQHDYYTDIITFDYVKGNVISGDLFISLERVKDNAEKLSSSFNEEFMRVIAHGILHLCGYKDKKKEDIKTMRSKENFYIKNL